MTTQVDGKAQSFLDMSACTSVCVLKGANFEKDQQAMKNQLMQLQILLTFVDPELANYLGECL